MVKDQTPTPSFTFTSEDTPVAHKRAGNVVNPFADVVAQMAAEWDNDTNRSKRTTRFTVPTTGYSKAERQVREAARAIGRGIRITHDDEDGTATVRFQLAVLKTGVGRPKGSGKPTGK